MSPEHALLVIAQRFTGPQGEDVRVALDVLRAAANVKVSTVSDVGEIERALARRGRRRPVVIGGDGVLHKVVQVLHRQRELADALLGLVPIGDEGRLAHALNIPLDPAHAARVVLAGRARRLDLIVDDAGGVAVTAVRVGLAAEAERPAAVRASRLRRASRSFVTAAAEAWAPGWRLRVEADGEVLTDLDRRVLMIGLCNTSGVEGIVRLDPGPLPDDGLADVVVSETGGTLTRLERSAARLGAHGRGRPARTVRTVRARRVTLCGQDFRYDADGVLCGPVRRRTWTVEHSAWRMTTPKDPTDSPDPDDKNVQ
ncbi:MAG: diacylglycerol/lipid kinase family protein [Carbonactinosporaceae bacterium]